MASSVRSAPRRTPSSPGSPDFEYLTARGAQRFEVRELVRVSLARHEIAGVGASLLTVYRLAFGHARQEDLAAT
jgi:hypothetical protein